MELHHSKHHAAYVNGLNAAYEKLEAVIKPLGSCLTLDPWALPVTESAEHMHASNMLRKPMLGIALAEG